MDMTNFLQDVIDRSFEKPVVVDFWAPWCGPCRVLGPVLEQLAEEQSERWALVKINSDDEFELAQQYQVMSIPNVKMFYQGKVVAEFAGALPRQSVVNWLNQYLPNNRQGALQAILEQLDAGNPEAAADLAAFVHDNPDMMEARFTLAGLKVFSDPAGAAALVEGVPMGHEYFDVAEDIRTLARVLQCAGNGVPVAQVLAGAGQAAREGRLEQAIEQLIEAVSIDKTYADGLPRKAAIALFRILGPQHELTKAWRRRFDMALY